MLLHEYRSDFERCARITLPDNDRFYQSDGHPHSEALHLIERFRQARFRAPGGAVCGRADFHFGHGGSH